MSKLETYFDKFRKNIVGIDSTYISPFGEIKILYADWIASGRLYKPIEDKIVKEFGPFVANTHTETSETGTRMTHSYHHAQEIIKNHVNAGPNDVLIQAGFGMTSVINKLQRILGFKSCGVLNNKICLQKMDRPVVFITHMEHHSNQTSWYETIAEVVILEPDNDMRVNPDELRKQLEKYKDRKIKIGSFTAASNVTGIKPPYYELAKIMHENNGLCFIDFAAAAPYINIDMHPKDPMMKLDAILFSPHKFLGGPGTAGIMVFDSELYNNDVPDNPGGGTVDWTNRWGEHKYIDDIEAREDGGTPGFLQAIRTALAIELKEQMGTKQMSEREKEIIPRAISGLKKIEGIKILAENIPERIGSISFYHKKIHFNFIVKSLSDRFGIQVRGGCACAGTYGHYMLHVSKEDSDNITSLINSGDLSKKPGWIRWSIHPTTKDQEIDYFVNSVSEIVNNYDEWIKDYNYNKTNNEFFHKKFDSKKYFDVKNSFVLD